MQLIDGKIVKQHLLTKIKEKINSIEKQLKISIIKVGEFPENELYLRQKRKMALELGIVLEEISFSSDTRKEEIISKIKQLNEDSDINGIMIQSPIPSHLNFQELVEFIDPFKDVDGLTDYNQQMLSEDKGIYPATVRGIIDLLKFYNIKLEDNRIVIIGKSKLVGWPLYQVVKSKNEVILCDSKTELIEEKIKEAEIIVIAIGKPEWLKDNLVEDKTVIIDVGTTLVDGKLKGDVDFYSFSERDVSITPVPGGVGVLTVLELFNNLIDLYYFQENTK